MDLAQPVPLGPTNSQPTTSAVPKGENRPVLPPIDALNLEIPQQRFKNRIKKYLNLIHIFEGLRMSLTLCYGSLSRWDKKQIAEHHQVFQQLGAEHIQIRSETGETVDGHYFDAGAFLQELQKLGGKRVKMTSDNLSFCAIEFDKEGQAQADALLQKMSLPDASWEWIVHNEKYYLVQKEGAHTLLHNRDPFQRTELPSEILPLERGTVIQSLPQCGIYEESRDSILAYLFEGVNVCVYNYPGKGLSTGLPTRDNINASIEAVYQYLHQKKEVPDSKIIALGLCFGSAPSAWLGKQHPLINLIMDQTPAGFEDAAKKIIQTVADTQLQKSSSWQRLFGRFLKDNSLIQGIAQAIVSGYYMPADVRGNRGHKVFIIAEHDELVPENHTDLYLHAALESAQKGENIKFTTIPEGTHLDPWWDEEQSHLGVVQFLERNGLRQDFWSEDRDPMPLDQLTQQIRGDETLSNSAELLSLIEQLKSTREPDRISLLRALENPQVPYKPKVDYLASLAALPDSPAPITPPVQKTAWERIQQTSAYQTAKTKLAPRYQKATSQLNEKSRSLFFRLCIAGKAHFLGHGVQKELTELVMNVKSNANILPADLPKILTFLEKVYSSQEILPEQRRMLINELKNETILLTWAIQNFSPEFLASIHRRAKGIRKSTRKASPTVMPKKNLKKGTKEILAKEKVSEKAGLDCKVFLKPMIKEMISYGAAQTEQSIRQNRKVAERFLDDLAEVCHNRIIQNLEAMTKKDKTEDLKGLIEALHEFYENYARAEEANPEERALEPYRRSQVRLLLEIDPAVDLQIKKEDLYPLLTKV